MANTKKTKQDEYCDWVKMQHIDAIQTKEQRDDFRKELDSIPSM